MRVRDWGEIVALEWRDVDPAARRLTIQRSEWLGHVTIPKGGRSRQLPMSQRLTAALNAARHLRSDRVLCLPDGASITRDRVIKQQRVGSTRAASESEPPTGEERGSKGPRERLCKASPLRRLGWSATAELFVIDLIA
jgi:integrase